MFRQSVAVRLCSKTAVDDYLKNAKWVERIRTVFDTGIDINKNGTVEEDDWKLWVENIKSAVNPDPKLLDNLTKVMASYTAALGISQGKKLNKDEFVKAMAELGVAENARKARGEKTQTSDVNEAWYNVVDKNQDGFITKDEFHTVMKACMMHHEAAEARFNAIDKNKDGKIECKELIEAEEEFWFGLN